MSALKPQAVVFIKSEGNSTICNILAHTGGKQRDARRGRAARDELGLSHTIIDQRNNMEILYEKSRLFLSLKIY